MRGEGSGWSQFWAGTERTQVHSLGVPTAALWIRIFVGTLRTGAIQGWGGAWADHREKHRSVSKYTGMADFLEGVTEEPVVEEGAAE